MNPSISISETRADAFNPSISISIDVMLADRAQAPQGPAQEGQGEGEVCDGS